MWTEHDLFREIRRGNRDWETFSFPAFYLGCKRRFVTMRPDEIAHYQLQQARNVVRYAARHAPFFNSLYQGYDLDDVWSLPTVDKKTMMDHLTGFNTLGLTREEILAFCLRVERTRDFSLRLKGLNIGMSSGTSGNKGVEITTPREEAYLRAAFFARFPFPGGFPFGKNAVNWAFILRVSTPAFNFKLFGNRLTYISQLDTLEGICGQLERLDPHIVSAPPSMLRLLARQKERGRLHIAPLRLVSYAEVLYPDVRAYLGDVFGCPLLEIYKATEGAMAMSCAQGSLHINEDLVRVELPPDEPDPHAAGRSTPPGQPSRRLLVTDLHKTSQPIVRYALNDILTLSSQGCPCGSSFRVIARIQGRADDLFGGVHAASGAMQPIFPDYVARAIIGVSDDIDDYQAIQTAPDAVQVRLQVRNDGNAERIAEEVQGAIRQVFQAYGCHLPRVEVSLEAPRPNPHSDKLIRIHRAFQVDF